MRLGPCKVPIDQNLITDRQATPDHVLIPTFYQARWLTYYYQGKE
jgi:hypothetical protein